MWEPAVTISLSAREAANRVGRVSVKTDKIVARNSDSSWRGARGSRSRAASVTGCGAASRAASSRLTNSCLSPSEERPRAVSSWRRRATVRLRTSATERFLRPRGIVRNGKRGKRRLHEGQAKAEEKRKLFGYQLSKGGRSSSKTAET